MYAGRGNGNAADASGGSGHEDGGVGVVFGHRASEWLVDRAWSRAARKMNEDRKDPHQDPTDVARNEGLPRRFR